MKKFSYLSEDHNYPLRFVLYLGITVMILAIIVNPKPSLKKSVTDIIVEIIVFIIFSVIEGKILYYMIHLPDLKANKRYKEIKQKGIKTTGKIIGWNFTTGAHSPIFYYVYVSYTDLTRKSKSI